MRSLVGSVVAGLALALSPPALAQERTGAIERITSDVASRDFAAATDVVIVSEGYHADEESTFRADAAGLVRQVRSDADAAPLREARAINLHVVFVNSKDRGAPWQPGRPARDTPFGAWVSHEGAFVADDAKADGVASRLAPDVDCVVILTRFAPEVDAAHPTATRAGALRTVTEPREVRANADLPRHGCRVRIPSDDPSAFLHELGHALFGLGDEYEEHAGAPPEDQRWQVLGYPNLTMDPASGRWADLVATPPLEGGGGWTRGVWRPQHECRMRESRGHPFCAVCVALIRGARPAEPAAPVIVTPRALRATTTPEGRLRLDLTWRHDLPAGSPARAPGRATHFIVQLRGPQVGARPAVDTSVEGHLRALAIDVPAAPGTYTITINAVNTAGISGTAFVPLEVEAPRPPTLGLAARLRALNERNASNPGSNGGP